MFFKSGGGLSELLRILLTNDDSHDSPLFHFTIEALRLIGDVEVVVPAEEQSWKGKAMTRVGALYTDRIDLHGSPAWSVTGTPADCVNLAVHNLLEHRPDVVVSGTNIGKNVGIGFIFASGTVGACLEANIAGLPALALSQELTPTHFQQWMGSRSFSADLSAALRAGLLRLIPEVWQNLGIRADAPATTWNVNFPCDVTDEVSIVRARIGRTYYDRCFTQKGDQYHHNLMDVHIDQDPDTDDCVVRAGNVSATEIDIRVLGQQIG
ncbi:MAG: 5'-nucleotidase [Gammaproteobacteria bacterium]